MKTPTLSPNQNLLSAFGIDITLREALTGSVSGATAYRPITNLGFATFHPTRHSWARSGDCHVRALLAL